MVILRLGNSQEEEKEGMGLADYKITTTLDTGSFGKVKLAKHIRSHELFALKIIDKNKIIQLDIAHQIKREIATLKLLKHPSIVRLHEAYELWREDEGMEFIVQSLDDTESPCKIMRCVQLALLCLQEIPNDRPSTLVVYSALKNEASPISTPKRPAFSANRGEDVEETCRCKSEFSSINDVTISQLVAR